MLCQKAYREVGRKMKSTGMIRKVDELGRVVIPIELRRNLGIQVKDALEIFVQNEQIVMQKYSSSCVFCGSSKGVSTYKDKLVCGDCMQEISQLI